MGWLCHFTVSSLRGTALFITFGLGPFKTAVRLSALHALEAINLFKTGFGSSLASSDNIMQFVICQAPRQTVQVRIQVLDLLQGGTLDGVQDQENNLALALDNDDEYDPELGV